MSQRILIADDEAHIRVLLEQTLEDLEDQGVEFLLASDGIEALNIIETHPPDLVFLDVMMPKLSGFEVCRTMKEHPNTQGIYVIMLTAKGQEFDVQMGKEVGADLYITKPFDPDEIVQHASRVLGL